MSTGTCYQQLIEETRRFGRERRTAATVFIIPGGARAVGRVALFLGREPETLYEFLLHEGGLIATKAGNVRLGAELQRPIPVEAYPGLLAALGNAQQEFAGLSAEEFAAPLRGFLERMPDDEE